MATASQQRGAGEPKPTVSYQGHGHLLSLIDEGSPTPTLLPICARCSREIGGGPYFCCPRCDDFHLHLHCGPLPFTIKTRHHWHPLELADTVVEDDSGEYYCEVCAERRDPRDCVYYCSPCEYISHLKCVDTEVASKLKGEFGDVELRTVGEQLKGRVVTKDKKGKGGAEVADDPRGGSKEEGGRTLKEVFNSLSKDELNQMRGLCPSIEPGREEGILEGVFLCWDESNQTRDLCPSSEPGREEVGELVPYSDDDFRRLLRDLDSATISWETLLDFFDMDLRVSPLQGQEEVPIKFAETWGQLTNKYGKLGARSHLSQGIEIFVRVLLCQVVYDMSNTGLNDVTEEKLGNWWKKLRVVHQGGFNVQFLINHLTKVVCAYFGREATRYAVTEAAKVGEEVTRVEEEIRALKKQLEELRVEKKGYESLLDSSKSSVMKRCLEEASGFGLSRASKGLFP